jgi:hypothetical protein
VFDRDFPTKLIQEDRGREIICEFITIAAASAIKTLNNKLAQKIINTGLEKGINTNDFIILRLCFYAMVKDWNSYSQLAAEIKFRRAKNTRWLLEIRFTDIYHKAIDLKVYWDRNKISSREVQNLEFSEGRRKIDEKISALGSVFAAQQWAQAFIDAGSLWEELKKFGSQEMDASKQITLRCYIEARIRGDKIDIDDEARIQDWLDTLYGVGGSFFDNIWLSLFATVADRKVPTLEEVREVYDRLLEDFNVNDNEKMEQLQRMNELRNLLGNETGHWWIDYAESWFAAHINMVKVKQVKRTISTLFNLKYGEQGNVVEVDPKEESDLSEWTEEVSKVTKLEKKEMVSGLELDVIRANLDSLQKQIKDSKGKDKKQLKEINLSCANAVKANEMLLAKLNEINRSIQKPSRMETIKRN